MKDRVAKSFTTPLRRFHVGQLVDESEIDGTLSRDYLIEKGFLSPGEAELPSPAVLRRRAERLHPPVPEDELPVEIEDESSESVDVPDIPEDESSAPEDKGVTDEHH